MNIDKKAYDEAAKEGFLAAKTNGSLTLYNYTSKAVFDENWNEITETARGLVVDHDGFVVAKPFRRFFNLNERPETKLEVLPQETPELATKLDGTYIVAFYENMQWMAVTRGCWQNKQTEAAQRWLNKNGDKLNKTLTHLFELTAPWNRIVVAYGEEKLTLLGIVDTLSGYEYSYKNTKEYADAVGVDSVRFETAPVSSIDLQDKSVKNDEGRVARFSNGLRVKLKYAQYVLLHKIVTGLSIRGIWESLKDNVPLKQENLPEEFMTWHKNQIDLLKEKYRVVELMAKYRLLSVGNLLTRKDYAAEFLKTPQLSGILFSMLDDKDYSQAIWKLLRPQETTTFQTDGE